MAMSRLRSRLTNQDGSALIIALMAMMLLTALGAATIMVSKTETLIANNHRNSQEALYAADAALERVVQDLLMAPRWNDILAGNLTSAFTDGSPGSPITLPSGQTITLNAATTEIQTETNTANLWGTNNPVWRLYAWGPIDSLTDAVNIDSPMYVGVWVADDPAETDNNPLTDGNGTLTLRAMAIGPSGTRKDIEITVARTAVTEIERGQIAQRGQEELNQRARKAAVETVGKPLTNMQMNTNSGGLVKK
jgi:hypothetical protein